ncbi:hypothetical protein [uncultured Sulfitobacter sp.]|uniref:hypothetical protein n=1 Tax=uncultured Sulfitobacter sp. TaxID=191468 RepID=UPI002599FCA2|nr:hypothetical protein [uncultured Sulfitobacter sp.]
MTTDDAVTDLAERRLEQMQKAENKIEFLNAYQGLSTLAELAMLFHSPMSEESQAKLIDLEHKATALFASKFRLATE